MKNKLQPRRQGASSAQLDRQPAPAQEAEVLDPATALEMLAAAGDGAENPAAADAEPTVDGLADDTAANAGDDAVAAAEAPAAPEHPTTAVQGRGGLATILGSIAAAGAAVAWFVPALTAAGLSAGTLLVLAAVLFAVGFGQRSLQAMQQQLAAQHDALRQFGEQAADKPPASGEELQHVLMSLQRQDEKINNLTKAIKMYGKPLMDIAGQSTDLVGGVSGLRQTVETSVGQTRQAIERLDARLDEATRQQPSLEPLQQHLSRLEVSLAAIAQRLENSEVHKSLLRLEETMQQGRDGVRELLKGDPLREATSRLQQCVDTATKGLADGLGQLRDGNLGRLEGAVRELQREIAGIATAIAQVSAAVKNGPRPAAIAAPTAPPPAATGEAPPPPAASAPATDGSATSSAAPAGAEAGGYQTGTRTTGAANVLGAIARLKKMKG
jgi:hypothetical protein